MGWGRGTRRKIYAANFQLFEIKILMMFVIVQNGKSMIFLKLHKKMYSVTCIFKNEKYGRLHHCSVSD